MPSEKAMERARRLTQAKTNCNCQTCVKIATAIDEAMAEAREACADEIREVAFLVCSGQERANRLLSLVAKVRARSK